MPAAAAMLSRKANGEAHEIGSARHARDREARRRLADHRVARAQGPGQGCSPETRERVLAAIEHAGFIPNQLASSMRGTGRIIGTMVPPLINSGIAEQVQGMSDETPCERLSAPARPGRFHRRRRGDRQSARSSAGGRRRLILQAFVQSLPARRLLADSGVTVVEISEIRGKKPIDMAVGVSNFETAYAMTSHLATKGYKRIGFVSTPIHGNDRLQQRRIGYRQAMADLGLTTKQDLEVEVPMTPLGGAEALRILTAARSEGRRDLLLERHAGDRRHPGVSSPRLEGPRAARDRRLWRPRPCGAALPAADHRARSALRDGPRRRSASCFAASSGDTKSPTIVSLGFQIIDRESA